ncbi:MAG: hypothetical protein HY804_02705 [Nitrospinae bacterium]|nr:hypothetical protein [Nitrospinota bacterium]
MSGGYEISKSLSEGWEALKGNFPIMLVATLIVAAIMALLNVLIPFIGSMLISGPLTAGLLMLALDAVRKRELNVMRVFDGFKTKLVPLVLVGILTSIFTTIGFIFIILPGILVAGWYLFSYFYVFEKDMDFWPAMEKSRETGFSNHVQAFGFVAVLALVNLAGLIALGVGLLVTIPLSACAVASAYEQLEAGAKAKAGQEGAWPSPKP